LSKNKPNGNESLTKSSSESKKNNRTNKIKIIKNNLNDLSPLINASNSFIPIQEYYLTSQDSLSFNNKPAKAILSTKNTCIKKASNLNNKKNQSSKPKTNNFNKKNDKPLNNNSTGSKTNGTNKMIESKLLYQSKQIPKLTFNNNNNNNNNDNINGNVSSPSTSCISHQQQYDTPQEQKAAINTSNKTSNLAIPQYSANKLINTSNNVESTNDQQTINLSTGK
jgi:hypothetical protein